MSYIIGLDIGTTSTKAVAITSTGDVLGDYSVSYHIEPGDSDSQELNPSRLLEAVKNSIKMLLDKVRTGIAGFPSAISFSCAMHSLMAVDKNGLPLTNAITWADLRSKSFADALKGSEAGRRIYQHTGTPIHPMSPLCKLLWLKNADPVLFNNTAKFLSIKEYIWWRLFGKYQVDYSIASATGLFDIYSFDWYPESLDLCGVTRDHLSVPVPVTHRESGLLPEFRQWWELPEGLPFIIGASDGCLANLGSNAVGPGATTLTIGTSGAVRMTSPTPRHDPKARIFNYILTDKLYVSGGATNNGGNIVQWFIENFSSRKPGDSGTFTEMIAEAETVVPGSEGLIFLPYLHGERAPVWNADAKGVFFGIRAGHENRHFMRAVLEGISYSLFQIGVSLEETIGPISEIYASGGFTRSKAWLQLVADLFMKKVKVTNVADASAIGAAILGFYALGMIDGPEDAAGMIRLQETFEPDPERHMIYQQNFAVFQTLYERLKDLM
ncbi:gluconokinase [Flavitalea flava]